MADKKISELPLINEISGSIVFVPIVHDGITEKITVEDFSKFTNKYAAQTGSVNVFTANQTINANLSVNGNTTISSNATVGGNLVVNGKLTAQEVHTEITSASIIFESGSTIFGNSGDDTHQFTGVVSINGVSIGAGVINEFTASQLENDIRMLYITGALNAFTASQIGKDGTLAEVTSSLRFFYQTTSSLHAFTASQIGKDSTLKVVTSSLNAFTASQIGKDGTLAEVTSSLRFFYQTTSSLHAFTSSQIGKDGTLALVTSSLNDFTQSQIGKDFTLSIVTSSLNNYTSSVIGQANTLSVFTSSINAFTGSQLGKDLTLSIVTSSIDAHILKQATQTGSQDLVNLGISTFTGSARFELNSIEAYTSSLKNAISVSGTNVQIIGDLNVNKLNVQYISSSVLVTSGSNTFGDQSTDKHEFTGSVYLQNSLFLGNEVLGNAGLNAFTGSQIGKDFTLSVVTSSIDTHILKQAAQTGSQDLVNYNISVYTGSQNVINNSVNSHILAQSTQTGSQDLVNYNISVYTGSQNVINTSVNSHILAQSNQTGSQDLVNLGISTFTGSLRSEVNLIEAYTASLKAAAIVSSSQQVQNYFTFARTGSANTFYGNQTFLDKVGVGASTNPVYKLEVSTTGGSERIRVGTLQNNDNTARFEAITSNGTSVANSGWLRVNDADGLTIGTSAYTKAGGDSGNFSNLSAEVETPAINIVGANVSIATGNLSFASGKGIDFSANSNAAGMTSELLNDYEEGTWTPVIGGTTSESGQSYSGQAGRYTKIGRQVTVTFRVVLSAKGTITGDAVIKGLPFTADGTGFSHGSGATYFEALSTSWNNIYFMVAGGETYASIDGTKVAGVAVIRATGADISNLTQFNGSFTYFV